MLVTHGIVTWTREATSRCLAWYHRGEYDWPCTKPADRPDDVSRIRDDDNRGESQR